MLCASVADGTFSAEALLAVLTTALKIGSTRAVVLDLDAVHSRTSALSRAQWERLHDVCDDLGRAGIVVVAFMAGLLDASSIAMGAIGHYRMVSSNASACFEGVIACAVRRSLHPSDAAVLMGLALADAERMHQTGFAHDTAESVDDALYFAEWLTRQSQFAIGKTLGLMAL